MYRGYQCIYSIIETTEKDFDVVNSDKYKIEDGVVEFGKSPGYEPEKTNS